MPKKSGAAHGGAQRNRPKVQKNIQLVTQTTEEEIQETELDAESDEGLVEAKSVATTVVKVSETRTVSKSKSTGSVAAPVEKASKKELDTSSESESEENPVAPVNTPPKGSAAERLAARRRAAQKNQQRAAASLITAEHYAYVRKDLIFIAILAIIMFSAIIILRFVPGIGY